MPDSLTQMAKAYFRGRTLVAATRLGIADALAARPLTLDELAAGCQADRTSLYRLLRALASFGILTETAPETFALTAEGRPLRRDHPQSEWHAVVFWGDLLADAWSRLTDCVREGETAFAAAERAGETLLWAKDPEARASFVAIMGTGQAEALAPIVEAWDFSGDRTIADLGGGGGALLEAVLQAYPDARGVLADRQEAIQNAAPRFSGQERCALVECDLMERAPAGADVQMLKNVLHGYRDAEAVQILRNCRMALPPDGRLLVIEIVLPNVIDRASPDLEKSLMSDLNMLAVTGGRERSEREWRRLLEEAGLACKRVIPVGQGGLSVLEAAIDAPSGAPLQ